MEWDRQIAARSIVVYPMQYHPSNPSKFMRHLVLIFALLTTFPLLGQTVLNFESISIEFDPFEEQYHMAVTPSGEKAFYTKGENFSGQRVTVLVRLRADGSIKWQKTLMPEPGIFDRARGIGNVGENIVICGNHGEDGFGEPGFVAMFDPDGNQLWGRRQFGISNMYGLTVDRRTRDIYVHGIYIPGANAPYLPMAARFDQNGQLLSYSCLNNPQNLYRTATIHGSDLYLISNQVEYFTITKLDKNSLNLVWSKRYEMGSGAFPEDIISHPNGHLYVAGNYTGSSGGAFIFKLTPSGTQLFTRRFNAELRFGFREMASTGDRIFVVGNYYKSIAQGASAHHKGMLTILDPNMLDLVKVQYFDPILPNGLWTFFNDVQVGFNANEQPVLSIFGNTWQTNNPRRAWTYVESTLNGDGVCGEFPIEIDEYWQASGPPSNHSYSTVLHTPPHSFEFVMANSNLRVGTCELGFKRSSETENVPPKATAALELYPNPTAGLLYLKGIPTEGIGSLQVYDLSGRMLLEQGFSDQLDVTGLAAGSYILKARLEDGSEVHRKFLRQ